MSVLLSYRNAERRPKCIETHRCLGISDVGRTSPAVPGRQSAAHFTKPGPFAGPCQRHTAMIHDYGQGRHCRLQGRPAMPPAASITLPVARTKEILVGAS